MKKTPTLQDPQTATGLELLAKSELENNARLKAQTLDAVAKLDAATVCQGCGSGWYNWGGSFGGMGGNWFGDSMCGFDGYCSNGGARRKHNRACGRDAFNFVAQVPCLAGQASGTIRTGQTAACVNICGVAPAVISCTSVAACTTASTLSVSTCDYTDSAGAEDGACITGGVPNTQTICVGPSVPVVAGASGSTDDCGDCVDALTGACSDCACNVAQATDSVITYFQNPSAGTDQCGAGEYSCKPGTCRLSTHVEVKTAHGHTLCVART